MNWSPPHTFWLRRILLFFIEEQQDVENENARGKSFLFTYGWFPNWNNFHLSLFGTPFLIFVFSVVKALSNSATFSKTKAVEFDSAAEFNNARVVEFNSAVVFCNILNWFEKLKMADKEVCWLQFLKVCHFSSKHPWVLMRAAYGKQNIKFHRPNDNFSKKL